MQGMIHLTSVAAVLPKISGGSSCLTVWMPRNSPSEVPAVSITVFLSTLSRYSSLFHSIPVSRATIISPSVPSEVGSAYPVAGRRTDARVSAETAAPTPPDQLILVSGSRVKFPEKSFVSAGTGIREGSRSCGVPHALRSSRVARTKERDDSRNF